MAWQGIHIHHSELESLRSVFGKIQATLRFDPLEIEEAEKILKELQQSGSATNLIRHAKPAEHTPEHAQSGAGRMHEAPPAGTYTSSTLPTFLNVQTALACACENLAGVRHRDIAHLEQRLTDADMLEFVPLTSISWTKLMVLQYRTILSARK